MNDKVVNAEIRVCDGDSKSNARGIAMVALPVGLLAVMGLAFLWCCPEWHPGMFGEHWQFKRQLCWNAIGIVAFCMPLLAGWTRWLRWAPVMVAVWFAMFAASQFSPHGGSGWLVSLGPIRLDVLGMLPFTLAMMLAWISHRFGFRAVRMLMILGVSISLVLAVRIAANANRASRVAAWFSGNPPTKELAENDSSLARAWAQKTTAEAFHESHWFSGNENHLRNNPLPGRFTSAMPASAALRFGKWFLLVVGAAFGFLGLCLARVWLGTADQGKKVFLGVSGLSIFIPAILGTCECIGLTPVLYTCVPLVSYGGTPVMITWLIAGTLASIWLDGANGEQKDV